MLGWANVVLNYLLILLSGMAVLVSPATPANLLIVALMFWVTLQNQRDSLRGQSNAELRTERLQLWVFWLLWTLVVGGVAFWLISGTGPMFGFP